MNYFIESLYKLYPNIKSTEGGYDTPIAFDENGNQVSYDSDAVRLDSQISQAKQQRALAYVKEADPLAFKMLRGEITKEEWEAKIEEIRARYPYHS